MRKSVALSLLAATSALAISSFAQAESPKGEGQLGNLRVMSGYIDKGGNSLVIFAPASNDQKAALPEFLKKSPIAYCSGEHCTQLYRKSSSATRPDVTIYDFDDADSNASYLTAAPRVGLYSVTCRDGEKETLKPMTKAQENALESKIRKGELKIRALPSDVRKLDYAFGTGSQAIYVTSAKFDDGEKNLKVFYDRTGSPDEVKVQHVDRDAHTGQIVNYLLENGLTLHIGEEARIADLSGVRMKRIITPVNNSKILPRLASPIAGFGSSPCEREAGTAEHGRHASSSAK